MKRNVVVGFIGTQVDIGDGPKRWERWRPTISLGMQPDFLVHRLELLVDLRRSKKLAETIVADIAQVSPETTVRLHDTHIADPWDFETVYSRLHDFCGSLVVDSEHEELFAHITTGTHVAQICWFLLTESRHLPGRLLQSSPKVGQLAKVAGQLTVIDLDLSKYDQIAQRFALQKNHSLSILKDGIQTQNAAFNALIEEIETVAVKSGAPILLMGPTGAGKSQLARRVFDLKKQRSAVAGLFVEVNCATLRGDGAMSTLFGHKKGAFTGAVGDRAGLLRSADNGILFLDEIGELGLDEQAMLLRALEDKRFLPVGSDKEVHSNFQLIAGTNRDLSQAILKGSFRDDLFARINMWSFILPSLAERREDIEANIEYELARFERLNHTRVRFNAEARTHYLRFAQAPQALWRGNFRDLGASISRMATLAVAGRIQLEGVEREITRLKILWAQSGEAPDAIDVFIAKLSTPIDLFDAVQLKKVITVCRASKNASEASRTLFAVSRSQRSSTNDADRLRKYLAKFGLDWAEVAAG